MSELGTVHIVTPNGLSRPEGVPYIEGPDDAPLLVVRREDDVTVAEAVFPLAGVTDWWWEVDPVQLPEWARSAAVEFAGRVRA